ncbi:hypothetical protein BBO99_00001570 [Phytophthora kernoviae]|uniref:Tudor domain-containing protein n=2 Tax=Phytophthora kernoviae TaxID=325452 RepID=A0A3R7IMZ2_9STRA|nr:hypothetical protein G195_006186 [Phytophthora kernoviae 00238/432]KAG2529439.1 hypothetical protein JM16_000836 [Phytophthora kernoviae]KAG2531437.1 hypothetical protein JM18_001241 [Phytophthora kernoviae]RLN38070.1 hypothetical protein BBI17_001788 [Phytophthora kernoviae]RLN84118.1 hypothetical protein BBO99_00001570 [Phytophthora kernoviae]
MIPAAQPLPQTATDIPQQTYVPTKDPNTGLDTSGATYVMDADGVWNVARVLSVRSSDEVEVTYDGWDEVYNEVVCMDSDRVAPYHTFTWAVKCWVKYLNWPLWPAVVRGSVQ